MEVEKGMIKDMKDRSRGEALLKFDDRHTRRWAATLFNPALRFDQHTRLCKADPT